MASASSQVATGRAMNGAEMFIARQYMLAQVFVTPLALISTLLVAPVPPGILLRDRIVETIIGAAVGIAVVLAPGTWRKLRVRREARTPERFS